MFKIFVCKSFVKIFFMVLGGLRKFQLRSIAYCVCERQTWRSYKDLADLEATMFIAPYGKQPLKKNSRVIIPEILYVLIIVVEIFHFENVSCI